jgi:hypothetical protein
MGGPGAMLGEATALRKRPVYDLLRWLVEGEMGEDLS